MKTKPFKEKAREYANAQLEATFDDGQNHDRDKIFDSIEIGVAYLDGYNSRNAEVNELREALQNLHDKALALEDISFSASGLNKKMRELYESRYEAKKLLTRKEE